MSRCSICTAADVEQINEAILPADPPPASDDEVVDHLMRASMTQGEALRWLDQHRPQRRAADMLDHLAEQDLDERERERRAAASLDQAARRAAIRRERGRLHDFHPPAVRPAVVRGHSNGASQSI